jgi:catechol 2,3-dioxygenase-like lactoylglutathione lyase family enzyme
MAISYLMLGSNDLIRSRRFYEAVLGVLGGRIQADTPTIIGFRLTDDVEMWIAHPYDGNAAVPGNGGMVGFKAESEEQVHAAQAAALAHGGTNEGDPGPRPEYGKSFYGGYVRDPDKNKLSFVFYRPKPETP